MISDFYTWLENDGIQRQVEHPASAEVIRTGLQPQVGANYAQSDSPDQDKIMALDAHVERIKEVVRRMKPTSDLGKVVAHTCVQFCQAWNQLLSRQGVQSDDSDKGLADRLVGDDELDYMKQNQPLPEPPRSAIPGGDVPIS